MRGRGIVFRLEETTGKCFCVKGKAGTKGNVLESSGTKGFTSSVWTRSYYGMPSGGQGYEDNIVHNYEKWKPRNKQVTQTQHDGKEEQKTTRGDWRNGAGHLEETAGIRVAGLVSLWK